MTRSETPWNGVDRQSNGLEENINARAWTGIELRWRRVLLHSEGSAERWNGKAMSCMAMALNSKD